MSISPNRTEAAAAASPGAPAMAPSRPAGVRKRPPSHPGAAVADILDDQRVSLRTAAKAIGVSPNGLSKVMTGKGPVTPAMALRFGVYFGNGPELWLNLQQDYDLWHARAALGRALSRIVPLAG